LDEDSVIESSAQRSSIDHSAVALIRHKSRSTPPPKGGAGNEEI